MHAAVAIDEESREFHITGIELWTWHSSGTYIIYLVIFLDACSRTVEACFS